MSWPATTGNRATLAERRYGAAAGYRTVILSWPVTCRIPVRAATVSLLAVVLAVIMGFVSLMIGEVSFGPGEVVSALAGRGSRLSEMFVIEWRLPRVVCAWIFGAMLGVSGAIFQTITRNPLGSPDIIGFTSGAYTGGIIAILLIGSTQLVIMAGAIGGGLLTAVLVYVLAWRGGVQGFRLVTVGVALTAMLASVDTWLILTAHLDMAMAAAVWGTGSLNGVSFGYVDHALILGVLLLGLCVLLSRRLPQLDFGDDRAAALGSKPETTRLLGVALGVALVAVATAITGPIAFVALAAPQIGRKLARSTGTPMVPAACTGALILVTADFVAQRAIPETSFPVGLVTVAIGGLYLLSVIIGERKKGKL